VKDYDIGKVAEYIGLDKDTMLMLLEEFLSVMDEEIVNLKASVDAQDAEMIKHYAHKMKGASANMMVEDVREFCSRLQNADKSDKELVSELYESITASYAEFKALL
jgi:HPt (histidine-containing phosphotransfer) domain-containing protein